MSNNWPKHWNKRLESVLLIGCGVVLSLAVTVSGLQAKDNNVRCQNTCTVGVTCAYDHLTPTMVQAGWKYQNPCTRMIIDKVMPR